MIDDSPFLRTVGALICICTAAAASRTIMQEDKRTFRAFLRGLILAVFAGGVVGALIQDFGFSPGTQGGIVGICAFVADDLLQLIINISRRLRDNPGIIISYFIRRGDR